MDKKQFIDIIINSMTLEQKVGQCFVIGFVGTIITPTILNRIKTLYPAGVRIGTNFRAKTALHDPSATSETFANRVHREPFGTTKDYLVGRDAPYCSHEEFTEFLNTMKRAALNNGLGLPLHVTFDMEGDSSADYHRGNIKYFPSCMGLAKSGNLRLAYDVSWTIARQVTPIGISWIHSPVLDVNSDRDNPEIGTRSYSEIFEEAADYALEGLKGLIDGRLIATGKHFPGRGHSAQDAHHQLPVIDLSREEMEKHLYPYKKLIEIGLPSIMSAHTSYPALDPTGTPASLSKPILTDLLKGEMGFQGAITTDDITMGGIVEKYEVADACVEALKAGNDLILFRDESPLIDEAVPKVIEAVRKGDVSIERIEDANRRSLGVKYDYGLFDDGGLRDENRCREGVNDSRVEKIAVTAADSSVCIERDEQNILPLLKDQKILLVEQVNPLHKLVNTQANHPGILWEHMLQHNENTAMVETELHFTEDDRQRIERRLDEADILVVTNYYYRHLPCGNSYVEDLVKKADKPVVIITNSPFPQVIRPEFKTIVVTYGVSDLSMKAVTKLLFR